MSMPLKNRQKNKKQMAKPVPVRRSHTVTLHTCIVSLLTAMHANAFIAAEMQLYSTCIFNPKGHQTLLYSISG